MMPTTSPYVSYELDRHHSASGVGSALRPRSLWCWPPARAPSRQYVSDTDLIDTLNKYTRLFREHINIDTDRPTTCGGARSLCF